jgi:hypothetical protein
MEEDDYFDQRNASRNSNHGDLFGEPQLSEYEQGRRKKQQYLIENIVQTGFDTTRFANFMEQKLGNIKSTLIYIEDGVNIDNWTFDGLVFAVQEFIGQENRLAEETKHHVEESKGESTPVSHPPSVGDFVDVNDTYIS